MGIETTEIAAIVRLNDIHLRLKTADLSGFRCPVGFAQSGECKLELAVDSAEHLTRWCNKVFGMATVQHKGST